MKRKRALALLFFCVGGFNLLRAALVPTATAALAAWSVAIPLPLLGVFYALCGFIALFFVIPFWRGKRLHWAFPLGVAYQLLLWALHLGYRATYIRALWARDLLLTVIFLLTVAFLAPPKAILTSLKKLAKNRIFL